MSTSDINKVKQCYKDLTLVQKSNLDAVLKLDGIAQQITDKNSAHDIFYKELVKMDWAVHLPRISELDRIGNKGKDIADGIASWALTPLGKFELQNLLFTIELEGIQAKLKKNLFREITKFVAINTFFVILLFGISISIIYMLENTDLGVFPIIILNYTLLTLSVFLSFKLSMHDWKKERHNQDFNELAYLNFLISRIFLFSGCCATIQFLIITLLYLLTKTIFIDYPNYLLFHTISKGLLYFLLFWTCSFNSIKHMIAKRNQLFPE